VIEYYRRKEEDYVWRVYMSKLPQSLIKDLPSYLNLIDNKNVSHETSEQSVNRLIDKINKYNGGIE
jgi:hypothetical protein